MKLNPCWRTQTLTLLDNCLRLGMVQYYKNQLKTHMKRKTAFALEVGLLNSAKGLHEVFHVGLGSPPTLDYRNTQDVEWRQEEEEEEARVFHIKSKLKKAQISLAKAAENFFENQVLHAPLAKGDARDISSSSAVEFPSLILPVWYL
ncbi:uncharacterized protein VSU04_001299 [Chlamydotis macqueenii]